jgi:hypothetical protein
MKKIRLLFCVVVLVGLVFGLMAEHSMRRFTEGLYLSQIENEAGMAKSYARILKDPTLSSDQKLTLLSHLSDTHTSDLVDQMTLVFPAYHKEIPKVCKELSAESKAVIPTPSKNSSDLKVGTTN